MFPPCEEYPKITQSVKLPRQTWNWPFPLLGVFGAYGITIYIENSTYLCWAKNPADRPAFDNIVAKLEKLN